MGAMTCHRAGCTNAMCDRYSDRYGYICWECYQELLALREFNVAKFMNTPANSTELPGKEAFEAFANAEFKQKGW